ncbi:MAG TPA: PilZ domain-containing protein [Polyangiaceae bacterium]|nr:PilZ domain-containing protein [Polyangiaceae bacterium]
MEDKRVHPRVVVNTPVSYEVKNGAAFTGLVKDISIGGTFVETTEVVPFGTEVTIVARFPGTKADLRLPGTVRWAKPDGFGVQFGALGARETHAISQLLKR